MGNEIEKISSIIEEVQKVIIGKEDIVKKVMTAILVKGHILIEDVPGVGKTTLALAFSKAMKLKSKRIQFTPDVLPTDITGFSLYNKAASKFEYSEGVAMCNLLLADEINRTSSKTQSALLEVMEEGKISVDGITREVPLPFIVIATQNPIGSIGTQMLPESQLDRFMIKLSMGYPSIEREIDLLKGRSEGDPIDEVKGIITREGLIRLQQVVFDTFVDDKIYAYVAHLVAETRQHPLIKLGISPRGSIALISMAKGAASIHDRDYVIPEDVQEVFIDVAAHRILLNAKAKAEGKAEQDILEEILKGIQK